MKIFLITKKAAAAVSGAVASWRPTTRIGVALQTVLRFTAALGAGVSIQQAPARLLSSAAVGTSLTQRAEGAMAPACNAGVALSTVAQLPVPSVLPGARFLQWFTNLAGTYGASVATISKPSGSTDWTNPGNARGIHNSVNATVAGQLTSAVNALMTMTYDALQNKTPMTISQVRLVFYASLTKSLLGTPSLTLQYSLDATNYTTLQTVTASNAGPFTFDITTAVGGDWAKLQNDKFRARIGFATGATDTTSSATCDAIELLVTAANTINL